MADNETNRVEQLRKQVAKSRALKAQGLQIKVEDSYARGERGIGKRVVGTMGGKEVGYLELMPYDKKLKGSEIRQVTVTQGNERKGIASTLLNEAKLEGLKPLHSNKLSYEGTQFKAAVGGPGVKPELTPTQRQMLAYDKINRQTSKASGKERAIEIAKLKAAGKTSEISTPEARRNLRLPSNPSIRPPLIGLSGGLGGGGINWNVL